jgi:hypothetical protein
MLSALLTERRRSLSSHWIMRPRRGSALHTHVPSAVNHSKFGLCRPSSSVFDLFYYDNTLATCHVPNCTPHVDPGLLTIVRALSVSCSYSC